MMISLELLWFINFEIILWHCLIIYVSLVSSNCTRLTIPYIVSSLFLISSLVVVFKFNFLIVCLKPLLTTNFCVGGKI
jgi:hypothetical protein